MSMIKLNTEALKGAMKKTNCFVGKTPMKLAANTTTAADGSQRKTFEIVCGTEASQSIVSIPFDGDVDNAIFFVSTKFVEIVETLGAFGDESFIIEPTEKYLKVRCGTAGLPVELLASETDPYKDADFIGRVVSNKVSEKETTEEKAEIENGCYRFTCSKNGFMELLSVAPVADAGTFAGHVFFYPTVATNVEEKEYLLRSVALSQTMIAGTVVKIAVGSAQADVFANRAEGGNCSCFKAAVLSSIAPKFVSDDVTVFVTTKRMIVFDGRDIYMFTAVDLNLSAKNAALVFDAIPNKVEYIVDSTSFSKALSVTMVTGDEVARVTFAKPGVGDAIAVVGPIKHNSVMLPATSRIMPDDPTEIYIPAKNIQRVLEKLMPETVAVSIPNSERPGFFVRAEGAPKAVFTTVINPDAAMKSK